MSQLLDRLLARRIITDRGCWEWSGCRTKDGYGQIRVAGKTLYTHIVAYRELVGEIPEGLVLDHRECDNPPCFNPAHLLPTTHRENILRGKGRSAYYAGREECEQGHPLTEDNVYIYPRSGARGCRICRKRWMRDFYDRRAGVVRL